MAAGPRVFLSYSHVNKPIARVIARRLWAHGVDVWIDETSLRVGSALTAAVRENIAASDLLLALASTASARAIWVAREIACAREHHKRVIPIFIDPVEDAAPFHDHVGIDAKSPQEFSAAIDGLIRTLLSSAGDELPPPDPARLRAGLKLLASEEPGLSPLIALRLGGNDGPVDTRLCANRDRFHSTDHAVNALYDIDPTERAAFDATECFLAIGAGTRALSAWIAATGTGGRPLFHAVADALDPSLTDAAIRLLSRCDPPNNLALHVFIHRYSGRLTDTQRATVRRLVTWPPRPTPGNEAAVLAWVGLKHFPEADEIAETWERWIADGHFDRTPDVLADYLADVARERLPILERLERGLQSHVRGLVRSANESGVAAGQQHIRAAVERNARIAGDLREELSVALGSAEWKDWAGADPEAAHKSRAYASRFLTAAQGDHDWAAAARAADEYLRAAAIVQAEARRLGRTHGAW